jgi:uncharacterized phiE125 gp8 family phage protein
MVRFNSILDISVEDDGVSEPIDLVTAKKWLRVEFTTDDELIKDVIKSVRKRLEKLGGISLVYKTITCLMQIDDPASMIRLPYGPVNDVELIEERTSDSEWTELTETTSSVFGDYELFGTYDIKVLLQNCGLFRFTYKTGFSELPEDLVSDMRVMVAWFYENRGKTFNTEQNNSGDFPNLETLNIWSYKNGV